jgi:molybdopterin adenylyltransferase
VSGDIPSGARALVLTISDGVAVGARQDESGMALGDRLAMIGFRVDRRSISDDRALIEAALREGAQDHVFVISTGGTGLTPRDVTPQATLAVIDYEVPGLAEAMRAAGRASTPMADLSRGVVGVIGRSLVVNVPGSPKAALESLTAIEPTLGHALETLAGPFDHGTAGAGHSASPGLPHPGPDSANVDEPADARLVSDAQPVEGDADKPWVPKPDENDEWRDLPPPRSS